MNNEQCGICWELKIDKNGKKTHGSFYSHDFTPFDFCTKCKQPKFDHDGYLTHPGKYDLVGQQSLLIDHEFSSSNFEKELSRKKRKKIIVAISATTTLIVSPIVNFINLLF